MFCTEAQLTASNIDCWTSIVQQVTRVWRVGEIFVLKLLTTRGFSADRGAADVRNRFAIILPVVITVVIIPSQYNSFFSLLPSLLGSLYLVFYPSSVYIPETQLLGGDTYTCTPRFLFCCWQFCGAVLCTGAQQSASNIDCWTSIVQQVTMP